MATAPTVTEVTFDLDAVKRPKEDVKEPFTTRIEGRVITMLDPEEIDWQDLASITAPTDFMRFALSREDRTFLFDLHMEGWKLGRLMEAYMNHYGLEDRLEKMQRAQRRDGLRAI